MSGRFLAMILIVVAGLLLAGCDAGELDLIAGDTAKSPVPTGQSLPVVRIIAKGEHMRYSDPGPQFLVITAPEHWQAFWQTYLPGEGTAPVVDFGQSIVLVGIQGEKTTSGYDIRIAGLAASGDEVQVIVAMDEPAPGAPVGMVVTQPYVAVEVDRDRLPSPASATFLFQTDTGEQVGHETTSLAQNRDVEPIEPVSTEPPPPVSEAFSGAQVLAEGDRLPYEDPKPLFLVITTQQGLDQFWKTYLPGGGGAPQVDWTDAFVLAGIQGNKSTGGYHIRFVGIEQQGEEVRVITELVTPPPDQPVDMAFSQPYMVVLVDAEPLSTRGALTFVFETPAGVDLACVSATVE
jgi:hypothetical protein